MNIHTTLLTRILAVTTLLVLGAALSFAETILIANKDVGQTTISAADAQKLFLGQKTTWANGAKAVPIVLDGGATHDSFLKSVIKKTVPQFSTFWKQAVFTGQGIPPKTAGSEAEMVRFVSQTKGAVGYINASTPHDSVKEIEIK